MIAKAGCSTSGKQAVPLSGGGQVCRWLPRDTARLARHRRPASLTVDPVLDRFAGSTWAGRPRPGRAGVERWVAIRAPHQTPRRHSREPIRRRSGTNRLHVPSRRRPFRAASRRASADWVWPRSGQCRGSVLRLRREQVAAVVAGKWPLLLATADFGGGAGSNSPFARSGPVLQRSFYKARCVVVVVVQCSCVD